MYRNRWVASFLRRASTTIGTSLLLLFVTGCEIAEEPADSTSCSFTYQCASGQICQAGQCISALEPGAGGSGGETGGDGGSPAEGGSGGGEGGSAGSGGTGGEPEPVRKTFVSNDYRRCTDSLECAVFGGNCLVELVLSRPTATGVDRIKLSDLDPSFAEGQGICGSACTNEPRICESVTVTGPEGESLPSTCQVVFAAESPYPTGDLPFPFDGLLDPIAMERGIPYASICRPPFEFAPAHSPSFCKPCTEPAQCGEGDGCWMERAFAATPSGTCVQACEEQTDCPFGFTCSHVNADDPSLLGNEGSYCIPLAGTCGRCLDRDGDLRGVGTCGALDQPNTGVDCDDRNAWAYYDASRPNHPFPELCGDFDANCNGISDRVEQLGSEAHCSDCGDLCVGHVAHGVKDCQEREDGGFTCVALCQQGFADCNQDPSDGCETELRDGMVWARDKDGDGRGTKREVRYFCEGDVPAGWVQNTFDCDDTNPTVYGGGPNGNGASLPKALELCDGIDNDCNGLADDGQVVSVDDAGAIIARAGQDCDSDAKGVCAPGKYRCEAAGTAGAAMRCVPNLDPAARAQVQEICNGLDDNCNGRVDEDVDWYAEQGQSNPGGPGAPVICQVPGGVGVCAFGTVACQAGSSTAEWSCLANEPEAADAIGDGIDSNCDGIDGDLSRSIFVRPVGGGGRLNGNDANDGSAQAPVATLARAIALACGGPASEPCLDIYVEAAEFRSKQQLQIPATNFSGDLPRVRIYGGFVADLDCDDTSCSLAWTREPNRRTTWIREAPTPNTGASFPFGNKYAAITASGGTHPMEILLDQVNVEVRSPDPSYIFQDGQSAPTQIGVECPSQGCGQLSFREVSIVVENAVHGGAGTMGQIGAVPSSGNDGIAGCRKGEACPGGTGTGDPLNDGLEWMMFGWCGAIPVRPSASQYDYRRDSASCEDGQRPHGGSSGAVRCRHNESRVSLYWTTGWSGGGTGGGSAGSGDEPGSRGADGVVGTGGSYTGNSGLTWNGRATLSLTHTAATRGRSGGGGGGAGGCLISGLGDGLGCNDNRRGGGGGAGGCNGTAGGRGGDGGSSIGLLLAPHATRPLILREYGGFTVRVGRGGNGGAGGPGGAGAAGGWGGQRSSDGSSSEFRGGHGGNGGGGGGAAGGHGGSSVGIWQVCTRSGGNAADGCGITLPPRLQAAPELYVAPQAGGGGGAGGRGGKRGAKNPSPYGQIDTGASPSDGNDGAQGADGASHHLYFSGGLL